MSLLHVGSIVVSGESNAYMIAAYVRDNKPDGVAERVVQYDPAALGGEGEAPEEHDLWEIELRADLKGAEELSDWIDGQDWYAQEGGVERHRGLMWAESELAVD